jgi:carbon storage regulator
VSLTKENIMSLILTRKENEAILLGDDIVVRVLNITNGRASIAITAPRHINVVREELNKTHLLEWTECPHSGYEDSTCGDYVVGTDERYIEFPVFAEAGTKPLYRGDSLIAAKRACEAHKACVARGTKR